MIREHKAQQVQGLRLPLSGTVAGFIATIPMTIFLLVVQQSLPRRQRYALPPEEITRELSERTHTRQYLDKRRLVGSSIVSHFSYGAATGALYTTLTVQIPLPPVLKGTLFGLIIWTASYLGWMPLANISAAAPKEPLRRNLMMIGAHMIWGSVTGLIADRFKQ